MWASRELPHAPQELQQNSPAWQRAHVGQCFVFNSENLLNFCAVKWQGWSPAAEGRPWLPYLGGCTLGWLVGLAVTGAALALRVRAGAALGAAVAARVIPGVVCSFTVVLGRLRITATESRETKHYPRHRYILQILSLGVTNCNIWINIQEKIQPRWTQISLETNSLWVFVPSQSGQSHLQYLILYLLLFNHWLNSHHFCFSTRQRWIWQGDQARSADRAELPHCAAIPQEFLPSRCAPWHGLITVLQLKKKSMKLLEAILGWHIQLSSTTLV